MSGRYRGVGPRGQPAVALKPGGRDLTLDVGNDSTRFANEAGSLLGLLAHVPSGDAGEQVLTSQATHLASGDADL